MLGMLGGKQLDNSSAGKKRVPVGNKFMNLQERQVSYTKRVTTVLSDQAVTGGCYT